MRPQAGIHVLRPHGGTAVRRPPRPQRPAPRGREPVRRGGRHALVPAGLRRLSRAGGRARGRGIPGSHGGRLAGFESGAAVLETQRFGRERTLRARLLVDATGPGGFLQRSLSLGRSDFPGLPATSGLYAHFTGVHRVDEMGIGPSGEAPPYPPDDAALHHVFDGGWIWVLRFDNGIVSAGVAAEPWLAEELGLSEGEPAWHRLLDRLPTVRAQFDGAKAVTPFIHRETLPFRSRVAAGEGWLLLPSAAAFVDPILSTGFPLTLLGLERLASALERSWGTPALTGDLARDAAASLAEADTAALLVAALYSRFDEFPAFAELSFALLCGGELRGGGPPPRTPRARRSVSVGRHPALRARFPRVLRAGALRRRRGEARPPHSRGHCALRRHRARRRVAPQLVSRPRGGSPPRPREAGGDARGNREPPREPLPASVR